MSGPTELLKLVLVAMLALPFTTTADATGLCERFNSWWADVWSNPLDRIVIYPSGTVAELIWINFGLDRDIKVTSPAGDTAYFSRTNRSIEDLRDKLLYPEDMLDRANMKGQHVLDMGCGGCLFVEQLINYGVDATGLDIFLTKRQRQKSYLVQAEALNNNLPNDTFDIIYSTFSSFTYEANKYPGVVIQSALNFLHELTRLARRNGGLIRLSPVPSVETMELYLAQIPGLTINRVPSKDWNESFYYDQHGYKFASHPWIELKKK